jgi:hypothetical protein
VVSIVAHVVELVAQQFGRFPESGDLRLEQRRFMPFRGRCATYRGTVRGTVLTNSSDRSRG